MYITCIHTFLQALYTRTSKTLVGPFLAGFIKLVRSFTATRPAFYSRAVYVGLLLDSLPLGKISVRDLRFSTPSEQFHQCLIVIHQSPILYYLSSWQRRKTKHLKEKSCRVYRRNYIFPHITYHTSVSLMKINDLINLRGGGVIFIEVHDIRI